MQISPLRQALTAHLGQVLTPEIAAAIEVAAESTQPVPWGKNTRASVLELMSGNEDATDLVTMVADWSHVYDDLIDKDKPVTDAQIHQAMWTLLGGLDLNPFFQKHSTTLRPLLMAGVLNWHAANQMERSGCVEQLRIAHVLRYSGADVAMVSMLLAGGYEHAVSNAARCRLLAQYDTWAHYFKEHQAC